MGSVFEARHRSLDKRVALKVLDARARDPRAVARFLREAHALAQLRHPNVVSVLDVGEDRGAPFLVMELLEGETLAARLRRTGRLEVAEIAEVMLPVISAISAAHEMGIVHRDLKPENVMLARRRHGAVDAVVLDFGLAKLITDDVTDGLTRSDAVLGSLHYMAPELTRSARLASDASDLYALGVMLYVCATGHPPVTGESAYEIMHAIATAPVVRPSARAPGLPMAFDGLVLRAMAREPSARHESVAALGSALLALAAPATRALWASEFAEEEPSIASKDETSSAVGRRRRWRWLGGWSVAIAVAAVALGVRTMSLAATGPGARAPEAHEERLPSEPLAKAQLAEQADLSPPGVAVVQPSGEPNPPSSAAPPRPQPTILPRRPTKHAAPRPSASVAPPASVPSARAPLPEPEELGTNDAPIYE
jgi:serine/threonine-protein kinase